MEGVAQVPGGLDSVRHRVEIETAGKRHGSYHLGGAEEVVSILVAIVAGREVAVERREDRILVVIMG